MSISRQSRAKELESLLCLKYVTIARETRLSTENLFFFFWWKKSPLTCNDDEKVADQGFLSLWPFENERKFRTKRKNAAKNLKFGKKWVSALTGISLTKPWNVRTHHHHTSYYTDHRFPIINTSRFVIHDCEFYLFLNRTVRFIYENYLCSEHYETTILLSVQLQAWNSTVFMNHNNHLVTPQNRNAKISHAFSFDSRSYKRNTPQFSVESVRTRRSYIENLLLWNNVLGAETLFCGNSHI